MRRLGVVAVVVVVWLATGSAALGQGTFNSYGAKGAKGAFAGADKARPAAPSAADIYGPAPYHKPAPAQPWGKIQEIPSAGGFKPYEPYKPFTGSSVYSERNGRDADATARKRRSSPYGY